MQIDFAEFESKHLNALENNNWGVIKDYCYLHKFLINYNFGPNKTYIPTMLEAIRAEWHDEWILRQIKWVEKHNHALSIITRQCKQELIGIPNFGSATNLETNIQDTRFQILLQ